MSKKKIKIKHRSKSHVDEAKLRNREVNLLETLQLLDKTMTQSLCERVFKTKRTSER